MDDESDATNTPTRRQQAVDPDGLGEDSRARVEPLSEEQAHRFPTIRADAVESIGPMPSAHSYESLREPPSSDSEPAPKKAQSTVSRQSSCSPNERPGDASKTVRSPSVPSFPAIQVPAITQDSPPPPIEDEEEDEATALLDREEILRNVTHDRKTLTPGPGTVERIYYRPPKQDETAPNDLDERTAEYQFFAESTREVNLDEGFFGEDGQIGFAARISDEGDIKLSAAVSESAGLKPGDLVLVSIRKVDG